jgi:transcriptional regulator with XRE-family HTH domain
VSYDRFRETRLLAGMSRKDAASLLFVTLRTIQLWERGAVKIPYAAFRLLRIHTGYELPGSAWRGFSLSGDTLITPDGKNIVAGDLRYLSLTFAMARQWKKEYAEKQSRERSARRSASGDASPPAPFTLIEGGKA